jgi:hypothetical protein
MEKPIINQDITEIKKEADIVSQSGGNAEAKALSTGLTEAKNEIKETKEEVKHVNEIMVVGICVLLFMLGTIIWTQQNDQKNSIDNAVKNLNDDRYNFQQQEIQFLMNNRPTITPYPTVTPTPTIFKGHTK